MARKQKPADADYALQGTSGTRKITAPALDYLPPRPAGYRPRIGLIGCGGITPYHLRAYRKARYRVVAFCDIDREAAERRRDEFSPRAAAYTDFRELLARDDIDVVDVATHPEPRLVILSEAVRAGKHILSQKPFVVDLKAGRRLVAAARRRGVKLAVNQNGRWAPHFSYLRQAVAAGLIGDVVSVSMAVHWDHNWVHSTPFNDMPHLLLYDFAIHWFDILHCFLQGAKARDVEARPFRSPHQTAWPPLEAHVTVRYPQAVASLVFCGNTRFGPQDRTVIVGTEGTLLSSGPNLNRQKVTLSTKYGVASPRLKGTWFTNGFEGTMGELLTAIEEDREPYHSAADTLNSLALAFAAIASPDQGRPIRPGEVATVKPLA